MRLKVLGFTRASHFFCIATALIFLMESAVDLQAMILRTYTRSVWPRTDEEIGVAGAVIEDFEDTILAPGLLMFLVGTGPGPTNVLQMVFDPNTDDPNPEKRFAGGVWDGSKVFLNRVAPIPVGYEDTRWTRVQFSFPDGAKSFGFSLAGLVSNFARIYVNCNILASSNIFDVPATIPRDGGRNCYLRIDAAPGERITCVDLVFNNFDKVEKFAIDHVAFEPRPIDLFWSGDLGDGNWHSIVGSGTAKTTNWRDKWGRTVDPPGVVGDENIHIETNLPSDGVILDRPVAIRSLVTAGKFIVRNSLRLAEPSTITSLTMDRTLSQIAVGKRLTLYGESVWQQGTFRGSNAISSSVLNAGTLRLLESSGEHFLTNIVFANASSLRQGDSNGLPVLLKIIGGTIRNTGLWRVENGYIIKGRLGGVERLENTGQFEKLGPQSCEVALFLDVINGGSVTVQSGELRLSAGGNHWIGGVFEVEEHAALRFGGFHIFSDNFEIFGDGVVSLEPGAWVQPIEGTLTPNPDIS